MNSVFSDEEISEGLWSSSAAMNRSTSEWAFERFLEELTPTTPTSRPPIADDDVLELKNPDADNNHRSTAAPNDFNHYRQLLKSKLDLACAAVALSRESSSSVKLLDSATASHSQLPSQLGSSEAIDQGTFNGPFKSKAQSESDDRATVVTTLPPDQKKITIQSRQTTSGSSKDDSDDDDLDGDMDNADPSDAKRARRMLSNRESARRSRRRKQAQMSDLETQVGQLRVEHSTLLNRLSDMNHKYDNAAVDNRILKADIETLRAKVKMAEQTVKRVTGINPLVLAASNLTGTVIPSVNSPLNESVTASVPMQRNPNPMFHQVVTPPMPHHHRLNGNFGENPSIPKNNLSNIGVRKLPEQIGPSEGMQDWGAEVSPQGFAKNHKPNNI